MQAPAVVGPLRSTGCLLGCLAFMFVLEYEMRYSCKDYFAFVSIVLPRMVVLAPAST